jgi:ABC-type transport system involved in cytochrome bd biosynthesis fused ATPase/permease subunit
MEADLSMLSGGELSRVNLAYTLALGEIFNTPLMLLDECTASLDQELTSVVIEGIKENYAGKMVIVVAHQVIVGLSFDREIKV